MVAAYQPARWVRLCELLQRRELLDDPRFASNEQRVRHREALNELLSESFKTQPTAAWMAQLETADILCAPIASYVEVTSSLQYLHSGVETTMRHPVAGTVRMPGFALGGAESDNAPHRPAPRLGEHSLRILTECGLTDADISALVAGGAVTQAAAMPAAG
jgi:crotonobetainyl-CoA:carnitine CoA-transferase CaiB-like acyl-CoA transferase